MKTLITTLTLTLAMASTTALAQEATVFEDDFESMRSRAAVIDRVEAAIERGERLSWGEARRTIIAPRNMPRRSTLTRAEVRAELMAALRQGQDVSYGEVDPAHNLLSPSSGTPAALRLAKAPR